MITKSTVTEAPVTNTGWALLNSGFVYLRDEEIVRMARLFIAHANGERFALDVAEQSDLLKKVVGHEHGRDVLPHKDPTPQRAQARMHVGWCLYHEQQRVKVAIPPAAASLLESYLHTHCTVTSTRSKTSNKQNARLMKAAA
jgi:hypothetical protein